MAGWIEVSGIALIVYLFVKLIDVVFKDREKMESIREMVKEAREADEKEREEILLRATTEMNKILLRRIVISIPIIMPLLWVGSLGAIQTPLGEMSAVWWYLISYLIIGGGVWIGSALKAKVEKGRR